ncbi:lectin-like domain-containing protein [Lacticaseibacillus salsurivasis]|uniref:lectin-like domain-containing protein n=1 Tax=Lacticaseibacillus salsurivasis TaxID=3081441 RepID=UPI0030C6716A
MEKGETKVRFKLYKAGRQWLVAGIAIVGLGIATSPLFIKQSADTQTVYAASQDEQHTSTPGPDEVGLNQQAVLDAAEVSSPKGQDVNSSVVSDAAKETDQQGETLIDQPQPIAVNDTVVADSDAAAAVDSNAANSNATPTTEAPAANATDQSTVVTVEGKRLDDLKNSFTYHTSTPNSAAGIKDDGQVVLTADASRQSGNLTLNNQIDLDYDFDLTGTITIGAGDGVAIGFHTGNTDEVGRNGGQNDNDTTVINGQKVPYFGPDPQGYRRFGAFAHTGDNGITIETNAASAQSIDPSYDTIHVHYEAAAQLLTIELSQSSRPDAVLKWTENIEHEIPKKRLVSFFIAGSTGDAHSKQGFKLNRFTYNAVGVAHVEYRDEAGALLLKGDDIHGIIGRTVTVLGTPEYQQAIAFLKTPEQGGYVPVNINDQGNVTFQRTHPETLTITMKKQSEATIHFVDDAENTQQADLGVKQITWTEGAPIEHMDDVNRQLARLQRAGYELVEDTRPNDGAYAPRRELHAALYSPN